MVRKLRLTIIPNNVAVPVRDGNTNNYTLRISIPAASRGRNRASDLDNNDGANNAINNLRAKGNWAGGAGIAVNDIQTVDIKGSKDQIESIEKLIALKALLAKERTNGANDGVGDINIEHAVYSDETNKEIGITQTANSITLDATANPSDFEGAFDAKRIININDINLGADPVANINTYVDEINALFALESLLNRLAKDYKDNLNTTTKIDADIAALDEYKHTGAAAVNNNIKHFFYDRFEYSRAGNVLVYQRIINK
jgi:hypothetical protein